MGKCGGHPHNHTNHIQTGATVMVQAFNALLECLVTGLFTAVFVVVAARIGMLPITLMVEMDDLEGVDEDEEQQ